MDEIEKQHLIRTRNIYTMERSEILDRLNYLINKIKEIDTKINEKND